MTNDFSQLENPLRWKMSTFQSATSHIHTLMRNQLNGGGNGDSKKMAIVSPISPYHKRCEKKSNNNNGRELSHSIT